MSQIPQFDNEPTLWLKDRATPGATRKARRFDVDSRQWVDVVDDLGNPVRERLPSSGMVGMPDINLSPMRRRRFITYLRHDGHIVACPITSAAASVPSDQSLEQYMAAKALHFGWVAFGRCPLEEHQSNRAGFALAKLQAPENREAAKSNKRCNHWGTHPNAAPCDHWIAEERARKANRAKVEEVREEQLKSAADKQADALTAFVKNAIDSKAADATPPAPPPTPRGGKP